ncbi:MAG: putative lipid II flippase FtsW [Acidimicrobiia bacterium]|nr:putative lipid II flippase FtsW [Acidimicrobiia bacterium]
MSVVPAPARVRRGLGPVLDGLRRRALGTDRARPPGYVLIVGTVAVLNAIGCVMVLSASSVESLSNYGTAWYFFRRQLIWTALGVTAFVVASRIDYRHWRRWVIPLLVVSFGLLLAVLVPGVGIEVWGSRRWLGGGALRFQPSEVAKLALVVFAADVLARRSRRVHVPREALVPVLAVFGAFATVVMLEPDMDSTVVLGIIVASVLVVGGVRMLHVATLGSVAVAAAAVFAVSAPYRRARVLTFLHPTADPSNTGYQLMQSLIALGSGGWTGVGLGAGRSKWMFLPNAHTDFIFAVIGEELGLLGCLIVVLLFAAFAVLGIRAALRAPDRFGMLLATGITVWIVSQALINIASVIGLLPVSGITLPFVSFGGSSLLIAMGATGVLANVARQGRA